MTEAYSSKLQIVDMTVFARQIATALRLIAKNGELCTWRSIPDGVSLDPTKPWLKTNVEPIDTKVKIVILPNTRVTHETIKTLTGTEVSIGEDYGLMAQVKFVPSKADVVIDSSGRVKRIETIDILKPDGTPILYTVKFKE